MEEVASGLCADDMLSPSHLITLRALAQSAHAKGLVTAPAPISLQTCLSEHLLGGVPQAYMEASEGACTCRAAPLPPGPQPPARAGGGHSLRASSFSSGRPAAAQSW